MPVRRARRRGCGPGRAALWLLPLLWAATARALPHDLLPLGDPLYEEARWAETAGLWPWRDLPLSTRPWQSGRLADALGAVSDSGPAETGRSRLLRGLEREGRSGDGAPRSTRRLLQLRAADPEQRLEFSVGVEGRAVAEQDTAFFAPLAGFHGVIGAQLGGWCAHSDLIAGHVPGAARFSDELVRGNREFILHTEDSYLQYTADDGGWQWTAGGGRRRFAWGPGEEGSLLLSAQGPPLSALWIGATLRAWRLHATSLAGNVGSSGGQQLAAHRLEWEPRPGVRLGAAEAVRYHSSGAQPLYLVSVIPYTLVQRILVQDETAAFDTLRNNVIGSLDASWRIRPGTRLYGELLVDDLHLRSGKVPNKIGTQLGSEGVGTLMGSRVAWGAEWTRLSRFVYTSFFGAAWASQDRPLGFALGPDSRRVRTWLAWDATHEWQVRAAAALTEKGENDLDEPFVPGSPRVNSQRFEGVVERTREAEGGLRWWPASGVDVAAAGGCRWIEDAGHLAGRSRRVPYGALQVRIYR